MLRGIQKGTNVQENVRFPSDSVELSGVVHIPEGLKAGERRPAIIMMHGFGANKAGGPEWVCRQFESWGYAALRFDYRGCGESGGERGRVIPLEEVADARNALTYMATRPEADPARIALCGSSLGAGVAVYAGGIDQRVAAVILENGLGNGERIIRSMHTPESWAKFMQLMADSIRHRETTGTSMMVHRFDIFEMPKELQINLTSNGSLMQFTAETAVGFFMFRPEEMIAKIAPRPILILHSARDRVCNFEEAFSLMRLAKPPIELHLIDGADHFMFVDPDPRVGFILRNWLDKFFPVKT
jgi:uncharacterized protein